MALTDDFSTNGMVMPVAPMAYSGSGSCGCGGSSAFGGDWAWILLLLVLGGGWGGFGGFGGGAGAVTGAAMADGFGLYPWLNNSERISGGFRDAQLSDSVTSVRDGINGLSTQLCNCCGDIQMGMANGFSGVNTAVNSAQNALAQQMYTNQISDLERSFAAQTASTQGMNAIQSQLAQCCCDNRAATADLKYTVASENCDTRYASAQNTQSIISALTAGIQSIKDDLCADRLEAERRENANLRSELMYARGQASQTEQTARILAGQASEIDAVYNRLKNCPVPSMPVYGNTPIFTCSGNTNTGCGCGCNGGF